MMKMPSMKADRQLTAHGWVEGKIANRGDENAFMPVLSSLYFNMAFISVCLPLKAKLKWSDENAFMSFAFLSICLPKKTTLPMKAKLEWWKCLHKGNFITSVGDFAFTLAVSCWSAFNEGIFITPEFGWKGGGSIIFPGTPNWIRLRSNLAV